MSDRPLPSDTAASQPGAPQGSQVGSAALAGAVPDSEEVDVSLLALLNVLLRQWPLVVGVPLAVLTAVLSVVALRGPEYTAESVFMPQVESARNARVAGLAAQLGVGVGSSSSGESLEFYAKLLQSRELLRQAVQTEYRFADAEEGDTVRGTLVELYGIEKGSPEQRIRAAAGMLGQKVSVRTDVRTGLVTLETAAEWPGLAVEVNQRLLALLSEFNLRRRQTQATAERHFVEARMGEAQRELRAVESQLESFLDQNRRFEQSPQLSFQVARLQRRVELRQQVYTSLAQAFEQARIEEVRNTPVITLVDRPQGSVLQTRPAWAKAGLIALVLGGVLGIGLAFIKEYMARHREANAEEYAEFVQLHRSAIRGVAPRKLLRLVRSARNGGHGRADTLGDELE